MGDVSVLIPFASRDAWRQSALEHVVRSYQARGWEVVVGTASGEWRKAVAVEDAAQRASGDVFVVADADCLCDGTADAVQAVTDGAAWAMPHLGVFRLTEAATSAVYDGGHGDEIEEPGYHGKAGGGIVVLPRDTWTEIPLDPRFVGWGQEDHAWAMALTALKGAAVRLRHDLWHLWHPPAPRLNRQIGSEANEALHARYLACRGRTDLTSVLVAEAVHTLRRRS